MKKPESDKATDDLESHPWLRNFNKKDLREQIETLKEATKSIENNLGTNSVLTLINSILIIGLMFGALITGTIGLGSDVSNSLLGLVKDQLHTKGK
jgi:hypothetical protein